jgi:antitoxin component of MazEF toxin-antitoxin module
MQTQIVAIGNSYGLRLPKPVLDALYLEKASHVSIQLRKDSIVLRPAPKPAAQSPRSGWFDSPIVETEQEAELTQQWLAISDTLDEEWQW